MRQVTADLFITLDGFAAADEAPAYFGYPGPELDPDSSGRTWARRSARSSSSPVLRCAPSAACRSSRASCRMGEVDRLRLMTFPLILGATGREPLFDDLPDLKLELVASDVLDSRLLAVECGVSR
jgi:hypothetical protein